MARTSSAGVLPAPPALPAVIELLKPITWFAPMWAYRLRRRFVGQCRFGIAGSVVVAGVLLAGPLVCGTSQAVNDWFDRHVDAINEPQPTDSLGPRCPGAGASTSRSHGRCVSLLLAALLGPGCFGAALVGLALAWAYSAPPIRLKRNGWWGNAAVGFCYEGLPWFTGAAVMTGAMPSTPIVTLAVLYSLGAHGIMMLNDFKSVEGDQRIGIASLPVQLGVERCGADRLRRDDRAATGRRRAAVVLGASAARAGRRPCWSRPRRLMMRRFLGNPVERAVWLSAGGVALYVIGMLTSAFALAAGAAG